MKKRPLKDPLTDRENTLYKAMIERRTKRQVSDKELTEQVVSDLLYSACG